MIGIYKITSPSKKIYIGQSTDIEYRWKTYKRLHCKSQTCLYNSFLKHGVHKHKFEIIQLCDLELLNELEKYYMDLFQTFNNKYGMNLKDGGDSNGKHSEETKLNMRKPHKKFSEETKKKLSSIRQNVSKETRLKMSLARIGKKRSEETIKKTALSNTGQKRTEESKLKMSISGKCRIIPRETIDKMNSSRKKLILNTQMGIFYLGTKDAALAHGLNRGTLLCKLSGNCKNDTDLLYV